MYAAFPEGHPLHDTPFNSLESFCERPGHPLRGVEPLVQYLAEQSDGELGVFQVHHGVLWMALVEKDTPVLVAFRVAHLVGAMNRWLVDIRAKPDAINYPEDFAPESIDHETLEAYGPPKVASKASRGFSPPTFNEVRDYIDQKGYSSTVDARSFMDYYAKRGWVIANGTPMKDWQAAVNSWNGKRLAEAGRRRSKRRRR